MSYIKSNKTSLLLSLCVVSALLASTIAQADAAIVLAQAETGSKAARQAQEQRERLAKKAAEREAKKAAEQGTSDKKESAETPAANEEVEEGGKYY